MGCTTSKPGSQGPPSKLVEYHEDSPERLAQETYCKSWCGLGLEPGCLGCWGGAFLPGQERDQL